MNKCWKPSWLSIASIVNTTLTYLLETKLAACETESVPKSPKIVSEGSKDIRRVTPTFSDKNLDN